MQQTVRRLVPLLPRARLIQSEFRLSQYGRAFSAETGSVLEVKSDEDFQREISAANDAGKLAVVDYSAAWCGPCKVIGPVYQRLSHQYPDAKFLKIDIDQPSIQKTVAGSEITSVPTFAFFKDGKELARVTGADVVGLRNQLDKLA